MHVPGSVTTEARRRADVLVWAMAALYAAVYSFFSIVKYRYYLYDVFDLAIFVQAVSRMLHGTWYSSIRGMAWLGDHSSLILFLVAPLYAAFHHPVTLLATQSALLGLGAVPVFRLAHRELGDPRVAVVFAALYLLYPAIGYTNLYEFHPEALGVPWLLFTIDLLLAGRLGLLALFAGLALLVREDAALVVGSMGLYALFIPRRRRWLHAVVLCGLAAASLGLSFGLLKPALSAGRVDFGLFYPDRGGSPAAILRAFAAHPFRAAGELFSTPGDAYDGLLKRTYFVHMLLPLLCLPLLSPGMLLVAAPVLFELFLSRGHEQHTIFYHYTALVAPCFVAAAVLGLRNLRWLAARLRGQRTGPAPGQDPAHRLRVAVAALALLASLGSNLVFGPLLAAGRPNVERPQPIWPTPVDRTLLPYRDDLIRRTPARGGLVASFVFLPRLAYRDSVHSLHHVLSGHYSVSREPYPLPRGVSALIAELDPERTLLSVDLGTGQRLRDLIAINHLRPAADTGNLVLFARDPATADSLEIWSVGSFPIADRRHLVFDRQLACLGAQVMSARVEPGGILPVRTYWRRLAPQAASPDAPRIFLASYLLLDPRDAPASQTAAFLGSLANPVHLWPESLEVRTTYRLIVPEGLEPGRYTLALRLYEWDGRRVALAECDDPEMAAHYMLCRLAKIEVAARRR